MLTELYIENIAVIEKSNIQFTAGLNVLTGETGAGKSIVIDSINAVMGQRTSKEIIRTGCEAAFVSAVFQDLNAAALQTLARLGFQLDDGQLVLQRELHANGKNSCRVNGRPASVSALKELGLNLINIHGQHESYELFSPDTHIDYIDRFGGLEEELLAYRKAYAKWKETEKEFRALQTDESARLQEIDLLSYQVRELEEAGLRIGEEEELSAARKILQNSEKLRDCLRKAKSYADGEELPGALELLDKICTQVQKSAEIDPSMEPVSGRLLDLYYNLQDCAAEIESAADSVESDETRLEEIEERLDLLHRLSRKYGGSAEEMLAYLERAQKKLESLYRYETNREQLEQANEKARKQAFVLAKQLSEKRMASAESFVKQVARELAFLDMPNVTLSFSRTETELSKKGCDKIELLVSANPGEAPKPIAKIASGGELSRIMLAVKTVLSSADFIDTLIFDEVDTGISGSAAQKVGMKLKEVSKSRQVFCVTHQAQIAAFADSHFLIQKEVQQEKTFTRISPLDLKGRRQELARIIGGADTSDTALAHAQKLLESAQEL